jgi:hypothetical protein
MRSWKVVRSKVMYRIASVLVEWLSIYRHKNDVPSCSFIFAKSKISYNAPKLGNRCNYMH